jgi:hypothetical protein
MTPEDKKLITVLTRLYAKTKADVVEWEPSEDANIFGVKFSDYSISLVRILATPTRAARSGSQRRIGRPAQGT